MPKVTKIEPVAAQSNQKKKVAAYARVSMECERLEHSLEAQIDYYTKLIQSNPEWEFAGIYSDDFISGTGIKNRIAFQNMLEDCELGKIDIILTKSISRFARNTVDLLQTVRNLKAKGIDVRFEKENINSLSAEGELLLTILASFAQAESQSISENEKWAIRKRLESGKPSCHFRVFGYRWAGDQLVPDPEEAPVVKRIFQNCLDGKSLADTRRELNVEGITTRQGNQWCVWSLSAILRNEIYTGDLLLQKTFTPDSIRSAPKKNNGELPQYLVEDDHPAIIDKATFEAVQRIRNRQKELGCVATNKGVSCFTGKIKCPYCGVTYHRYSKRGAHRWNCYGYAKTGRRCAVGASIDEESMKKALASVLGVFDEETFNREVAEIYVPKRYTLEIHLTDGRVLTKPCPNKNRKDE